MWCDLQSPAMMGLQATASKRKLEYDSQCQPAKLVRLDEGADVDDWRLAAVLGPVPLPLPLPLPHQSDDDEDDDDDDDEEDDEDDDKGDKYLPPRTYQCLRYAEGDGVCYPQLKAAPSPQPAPAAYYPEEAAGYGAGAGAGGGAAGAYGPQARLAARYQPSPTPAVPRPAHHYWGSGEYYSQNSQQTIRCDENGKSYLDLGSSSARYGAAPTVPARSSPPPPPPPPPPQPVTAAPAPAKDAECCDGRTGWCGRGPDAACYRQRRLAVLNISMCKLGRYRQFPDPSLRRSVLICNTLRYIEREMEQEGCFFGGGATHVPAAAAQPQPQPQPPPPAPTPQPRAEPEPSYQAHFADVSAPSPAPAPAPAYATSQYRVPAQHGADLVPPYEHTLRDFSASGRATPFPVACATDYDADSGVGDEESARGINWGSVLSLSSQSDLDPLNNNELYSPSPPHSSSSSSSSSFGFTSGDSNGSLSLLGDVDLGHEFDDFLPSWKLTPLSADDILKSVPPSEFSARQGEGELDSIMHVLVGT